MPLPVRSLCRVALIAGATLFATSAFAQMELKIIAPAAPGGGWDQTARSIQQALTAEKLVKSAQVINIAGAGGTVGRAQFVSVAKVTFAGGAAGGVDHIMAALFVGAAGADASKVNYVAFSGGGESLAAILGGKVTAGFSGLSGYEGEVQ